MNFRFMLPCIVIDFFLNNQSDALIIQIYSVIKLYMFRASSLPIIRSFLLYIRHWLSFMQVFDDRFQAESGCSILSLLGKVIRNLHETYQCRMYSRKLPMMGKRSLPVLARNESLTLYYRESKCFFRGPEILMGTNNYTR